MVMTMREHALASITKLLPNGVAGSTRPWKTAQKAARTMGVSPDHAKIVLLRYIYSRDMAFRRVTTPDVE